MRQLVPALLSTLLGCATVESARQARRDQLAFASRVVAKVPVTVEDGVELRFQMAELKLLVAQDLLETGQPEAADQSRSEAGVLLDELLEKAPGSPRTRDIVVSRASVAVLRGRHDEAVTFLRRGLEFQGHTPDNERFLRANLPRSLRLSGDCPGTLALSIPPGVAGVVTHLERAVCLRPTPEAVCDELLAAVPSESAPDPRTLRPARIELQVMPSPARAACLERFPEATRAALRAPEPAAAELQRAQ